MRDTIYTKELLTDREDGKHVVDVEKGKQGILVSNTPDFIRRKTTKK